MAEGEEAEEKKFYDDARCYWNEVPATVDGMLGGFAATSPTDVRGSSDFLRPFLVIGGGKVSNHRVLDCGAGIGRVTQKLLLPLFETVDMVEQNQNFLNQAKYFLKRESGKIGHYFCCGLQEFTPEPEWYNVIWCQWVLGHLTDEHLVAFFRRCKTGLAPGGIMVIKENVSSNEREFDEKDSSYTRPKQLLMKLIRQGGLNIIKDRKQKGFPQGLYDVYMFAVH